jgi:hypothetical protein
MYRGNVVPLLVVGFLLLSALVVLATRSAPPEANAVDASAVAVVELFTSQGCSSCPPADRLLQTIDEKARAGDRPVFPLAFHVDYWNDLGWADPYSRPEFSERQREYARALNDRVYTPQMVINGRHAFVGSDAFRAERAIESELRVPAPVRLTGLRARPGADSVHVTVMASSVPEATRLNVVLVDAHVGRDVSRGENAGRTLHHVNVVRMLRSVPLQAASALSFPLPDGLDHATALVVAYAQDERTMSILGASQTVLK